MIKIIKTNKQVVHAGMLSLYSSLLLHCNQDERRHVRPETKDIQADAASDRFASEKDMAFSMWYTHQSFAAQLVVNQGAENPTQHSGFSKRETRPEDVIAMQLESMRIFLDNREVVDKMKRVNQWFEAQIAAERALSDFVKRLLSLDEDQLSELVETDEYYTDVLSRQNYLLELIRRREQKNIESK